MQFNLLYGKGLNKRAQKKQRFGPHNIMPLYGCFVQLFPLEFIITNKFAYVSQINAALSRLHHQAENEMCIISKMKWKSAATAIKSYEKKMHAFFLAIWKRFA